MAGDEVDPTRVFLSTLPPGPTQRRLALAIILVSGIAFAALLPFAQQPLPKAWAFIPTYQSALALNDLITATLLFGQFHILRSRGLLALASAYVFSACAAALHMLTFPGLFAETGLLGAGPQTTAWLYMFWHGGFPLAVAAYAWFSNRDEAGTRLIRHPIPAFAAVIASVVVLACAFVLLATAGHDALPAIMRDQRYTPAMKSVVASVWALNLLALAMMWRRRSRSVLDTWIVVVMWAWLFDISLAAVFNAGRFDLGFYAGRIYGLLASSFVLLVLLLENGMLYKRLVDALDGERRSRRAAQEKTSEVNDLNDSLERRIASRTGELQAANESLQREIADRVRAESGAHEARQRLAGIIDSAMDAIITVDADQRIVLFNLAAERIFGCPVAQALGAPLARFIPQRFRATHADHIAGFGQSGDASRRMSAQRIVTALRGDGEEFPIDASISQVMLHGDAYYTVILRDVTERLRAEEDLRQSRENLHEMASVSSSAREQEKSRIARELHDELAQALTALKMDLGWLKTRGGAEGPQYAAKVAAMDQMLDRTVAATRRISADLRPLMLDDLGLVAAAQWLAQTFRERHGIACELTVDPPEFDLADPHATVTFRIMQESLTNIARHAGASRVEVELRCADGRVTLCVRDDGRGFNPRDPRKPTSYGLVGLRERAYLVDGTIEIDSAPGKGTTIELSIPLPSA